MEMKEKVGLRVVRRHRYTSPWAKVSSAITVAAVLLSASVFSATADAKQFLDDFEGDGEITQIPAASLRNWDIITSIDLQTESYNPPLCHLSGSCVDLVGTAGSKTGGIISKLTYPDQVYMVGFFLYGSGRNSTGEAVSSGGTVSRLQVSFGSRSIYANNNIPSDFGKFVTLRVRGSGKLKLLGGGEVIDIGPIVDNILIVPINP